MITVEGKNHVRRYMAEYVPSIARSVAFGIGNRAEAGSDMALQLESARSPINLKYYDFAANKLVFKASIPDDYVGKIYEIGLYSLEDDPQGIAGSQLITSFDSASEDWMTNSTTYANFGTTSTRIGADSLLLAPAASGSATASLSNIELDLSDFNAADVFTLAFNCGNAFTSTVRFRFLTDGSNFYDINTGAQTAGYKILEFAKSSAVATGTPSWDNITEIQITVVATSGGAASVELEAVRMESKAQKNLDYILVARKVLSTPVTKVSGQSQDVEISLDITL